MSIWSEAFFTGMYTWAQTHINTRGDATSVAAKDVRLNLVRSLHWRLMYQFLNSLPQLTPVYTHTCALMQAHRLLCAPGAVPLEGYSKGSILKACCHSDHYGAHPPWASKLYTTSLAEHTYIHINNLTIPPTYLQTHIDILFLPFMLKLGPGQCLTWTKCHEKQENRSIRA